MHVPDRFRAALTSMGGIPLTTFVGPGQQNIEMWLVKGTTVFMHVMRTHDRWSADLYVPATDSNDIQATIDAVRERAGLNPKENT